MAKYSSARCLSRSWTPNWQRSAAARSPIAAVASPCNWILPVLLARLSTVRQQGPLTSRTISVSKGYRRTCRGLLRASRPLSSIEVTTSRRVPGICRVSSRLSEHGRHRDRASSREARSILSAQKAAGHSAAPMRSRLSVFLFAVMLSSGDSALADDSNFRPYILGSRAAGMGGAFTALSDDGSGSYYNPGGLAFTRRSSISLSVSVYGVVTGSYANALGTNHDFTYSDLNVVPSCTSAIRKFGEPNPETGVADNTLVLSVLVPDLIHNDDRDSIGSPENAFFLSQDSQTLWIGGGYARRFGRVG